MKKILIIENDISDFSSIKEIISSKVKTTKIFPLNNNESSNANDYSNFKILVRELRKNNADYEKIMKYYIGENKIDLYIVDISLSSSDDNLGIEFLKYLYENSYLNNNYIILSGHTFIEAEMNYLKNLPFKINNDNEYVQKSTNDRKLITLIKEKLHLSDELINTESDEMSGTDAEGNNKKNNILIKIWKKLTINGYGSFIRRIVHQLITIFFFLLFMIALRYAFNGIWEGATYKKSDNISHTINNSHNKSLNVSRDMSSDTNNKTKIDKQEDTINDKEKIKKEKTNNEKNDDETIKLKFIEKIFLYLIPLFVLFGFYEYYRLSTGALLNEENSGEYNPENALKSLSNTKGILLATFLSFGLIKAIEIIFIQKVKELETLIGIGVYLIIIMSYLLISHINNKEN